jgi:uncharacterized protein
MDLPSLQQRLAVRQCPNRIQQMHQRWDSLAFFHWQVSPEAIRALLPPGLNLDLYEGRGWVGLVPFQMRAIRPVGLPPLPWISYFLEMNLRTYVFDDQGRPGVWFFSLDCNQPIAVRIARTMFHLPYFDAKMSYRRSADGLTEFQVQRRGFDNSQFCYRFGQSLPLPQQGSLEFFLLERYLLFAWDKRRQRLKCGQVFHQPYQPCELELMEWSKLPFVQAGFDEPAATPHHLIAARGVQVKVFGLQ